jgi:hypothetical protein
MAAPNLGGSQLGSPERLQRTSPVRRAGATRFLLFLCRWEVPHLTSPQIITPRARRHTCGTRLRRRSSFCGREFGRGLRTERSRRPSVASASPLRLVAYPQQTGGFISPNICKKHKIDRGLRGWARMKTKKSLFSSYPCPSVKSVVELNFLAVLA